MPAASALRAEKAIAERSRGAHPCVAQLASSSSRYGTAPAILAESCRMNSAGREHSGRDLVVNMDLGRGTAQKRT